MRALHRWISTTALLLLAWVSITGSLLALDEATPPAAVLPPSQLAAAVALPPTSIFANGPTRIRWHNTLKRLHTGSVIGISGRTLDVLTGTSFVLLTLSGIVLYLQMLRARRRIGRSALFWG